MKPVEIYVTEGCKLCARARQLLMSKGVLFTERDITFADDLRQELVRRCGKETTPQIFIGGEHIGGYEELRRLDESGELARKLSYSGDASDLRTSHV
ncbi:MAG: glutaredoxin family protein [Myxococcaceae bacterium]|nr:glutaredoxin family protein [Myxococcaceae bacterium]